MALSRAANALGVGMALGEIAPQALSESDVSVRHRGHRSWHVAALGRRARYRSRGDARRPEDRRRNGRRHKRPAADRSPLVQPTVRHRKGGSWKSLFFFRASTPGLLRMAGLKGPASIQA